MKKIFALSILLLTLGGVFFKPDYSIALEYPIKSTVISQETQEDNVYEQIQLELDKSNIPKSTQIKLITKLKNGEQWDSMNPEKLKQIPKDYFKISGKTSETKRYTFEDGSFIEQSINIEPTYTVKDIDGGTVNNGTGYHSVKGANVHVKKGVISLGFKADYTLNNRMDDDIDNVYDDCVKVIGGSYSNRNLKIISKKENANGPAKAELTADVSFAGGILASDTERLTLFVGDDKAWTQTN